MPTDNSWAITQTRRFYGPSHTHGLYIDRETGTVATFPTIGDARRKIAELDAEVYHTAQGEYARPEYHAARIGSRRFRQAARAHGWAD